MTPGFGSILVGVVILVVGTVFAFVIVAASRAAADRRSRRMIANPLPVHPLPGASRDSATAWVASADPWRVADFAATALCDAVRDTVPPGETGLPMVALNTWIGAGLIVACGLYIAHRERRLKSPSTGRRD